MIYSRRVSCSLLNLLVLGFLVGGSQLLFAIGSVTITGKINRDASVGQFDLMIEIDGSSVGLTKTGSETNVISERLEFYLPDVSSEVMLFDGQTATANLPYTFVNIGDPIETASANDLKKITYKIRIKHDGSDIKKLDTIVKTDTTGKYVTVKLKYKEGGKVVGEETGNSKNIYVSSAIVKSAPDGFAVKPTHQTIKMNWTSASSTKYNDDTTGTISRYVAVAIAQDAYPGSSTIDIPAKEWTNAAGATSDLDASANSCLFTKASESFTCSDSTKNYIDTAAVETLSGQGIYVVTADSTKGSASFTQLENGKKYFVFAYFEPGGLERTSVIGATPEENKTGAEIAGEGDAKWELPRCFIATAAYGTPLHSKLKRFTWFRDRVLMNFDGGRKFVRWYYKNSPAAAKIISDHPMLASLVRGALWLPAGVIGFWKHFLIVDSLQKIVIGLSLFLTFIGFTMMFFGSRIRNPAVSQRL